MLSKQYKTRHIIMMTFENTMNKMKVSEFPEDFSSHKNVTYKEPEWCQILRATLNDKEINNLRTLTIKCSDPTIIFPANLAFSQQKK